MALNINANEGQNNAPDQTNQQGPDMNNPNTGFGAPPNQDQNPPQNNGGFGAPNQQQHNYPQNNGDFGGPDQGAPANNPNQNAPVNQPNQNNGGGFAGTFHQNAPQNNGGGGFGNQPQNNAPQQQNNQVPANLMKTGADAYQAFQNAQQSQGGGDRRFFLKQGEERTVVFLDGDLDENGFFRNPVTREHTVKMGNKFQNILCLEEQEPCPLCQLSGNENSSVSRASFVCYFTVLDRTGYVDQQGNRHADFVSIYVAKTNTLKQLQTFAKKLGGLRGQEMSITRTHSNNAPRVGDMFIPGQKYDVQQQIIPYFVQQGRKADEFQPYDYQKALTYYSADQLRSMGFNDGHFSGAPSGFNTPNNMNNGGMNNAPNNNAPGAQGGGFGNQGAPANQNTGGFGNQPQNQNNGGGFGNPNNPPQNTGGFGNPNGAPGPVPTNPNTDYSQEM